MNSTNDKKILLPIDHLKALNEKLDDILIKLDEASSDFDNAFFDVRELDPNFVKSEEHAFELYKEFEKYGILSTILIEHPLISLISSIRSKETSEKILTPISMIQSITANPSINIDGSEITFQHLARWGNLDCVVFDKDGVKSILPVINYYVMIQGGLDYESGFRAHE